MNILIGIISTIALALGTLAYTADDYGGFEALGAIGFPISLDTLTNPNATDSTQTVSHSGQHSDANDGIESLQAKVGIDGSAVTTSHDYKLSGVTGSDLACSLTGTEVLTNKTLTSPNMTSMSATTTNLWGTTQMSGTQTLIGTSTFTTNGNPLFLDLGSDATGDVFYRDSVGEFTRLAVGTNGDVLKLASGIPSWDAIGGGTSVTPEEGTASGVDTFLTGVSVTADDVVQIWASAQENTTCSSAGGDELIVALKIKQSTFAATTTVRTFEQSSATDGCSITIPYMFTATTTETLNIHVDITSTVGDDSDVMIQTFAL